jgi:hypothetical protein
MAALTMAVIVSAASGNAYGNVDNSTTDNSVNTTTNNTTTNTTYSKSSTYNSAENLDLNNVNAYGDNSQAYLVYGNYVVATANATQYISEASATVTPPGSGSTSTMNGNASSNGTGINNGNIIQYNNSATAYAVGGATVGN